MLLNSTAYALLISSFTRTLSGFLTYLIIANDAALRHLKASAK